MMMMVFRNGKKSNLIQKMNDRQRSTACFCAVRESFTFHSYITKSRCLRPSGLRILQRFSPFVESPAPDKFGTRIESEHQCLTLVFVMFAVFCNV